jgi:hypothetical protein
MIRLAKIGLLIAQMTLLVVYAKENYDFIYRVV